MKKTNIGIVSLLALALGSTSTRSEEPRPVDQGDLNQLLAEDPEVAFEEAFEAGDELTEASFTAERGVGANVTAGVRFTRIPRADLSEATEWASHVPQREGGPNATSCISCHGAPIDNGAGGVAMNVVVDPLHTGDPSKYLERNTPHLFALGAAQRLAEEITTLLHAQRDDLKAQVCRTGGEGMRHLSAKSIDFGILAASASAPGSDCEVNYDTSKVAGVDEDLVVKAFGWKGNFATIREFTRSAAHNELGLQAVELVGPDDGDQDGVVNELTIGDLTALSIYMAALERPASKIELGDLGLIEIDEDEYKSIQRGEVRFLDAGCESCHVSELRVENPVFQEPSAHPSFRELVLPAGINAIDVGLDYENAVSFDLTSDQPNNRIQTETCDVRLGSFNRSKDGEAIVRWYSDFKRHDMGPSLADPVDAFGYGASVWLTRSLAGVGSTGPWLHNGHATTLHEAIEAHGGEAAKSRERYRNLGEREKGELITFLESLVIYKHPEEEEEE